jgi:hypothetical protein
VLWVERGVVNKLFKPLELWQAQCAETVTGQALPAGHFILEKAVTHPRRVALAGAKAAMGG